MGHDQDARRHCAQQIVRHAWRDLPSYDRTLLESIGASQWLIVTGATGRAVDDLLRSAGYQRLDERTVADLDTAAGVWIAAGQRLLELAPDGVREFVRRGGYRRSEYTHELVAEIYALLMSRRRRGQSGQPPWLDDEIYELVRRVSGWSE